MLIHDSNSSSPAITDRFRLLYVDLLERSNDIAIVIDMNGNILFMNKKAEDVTGYCKEECLYKNMFSLLVPKDHKRTIFNSMVKSASSSVERYFNVTNPILTRSGMLRTISWSNTVIFDDMGYMAGILCAGIDETEKELFYRLSALCSRHTGIDDIVRPFMDMVSEAFNIKLIRLSAYDCGGRIYLTRTGRYAHGTAVKKASGHVYDRQNITLKDSICNGLPGAQDSCTVHRITLIDGTSRVGMLEIWPHQGVRLNNNDIEFLRSLCRMLSTAMARLKLPGPDDPGTSLSDRKNALLSRISTGMAIIDAASLTFTLVNDHFLKESGIPEVIGRPVEEIFPDARDAGMIDTLQELIFTGGSTIVEYYGRSISGETQTGLTCHAVSIKNKDGLVSAILLHSINDKGKLIPDKKSELELGLLGRRIREMNTVMSQISDAVVVYDHEGRIQNVNGAFCSMLMADMNELMGRSVYDVILMFKPCNMNGKHISKKQMPIYRSMKNKKEVTCELSTIKTSFGSTRAITVSATPVFDDTGNVIGGTAIFKDVTMSEAVFGISNLLVKTDSLDDLLEESLDIILNAMGLKTIWLYLYDDSSGELRLRLIKGEYFDIPPMDPVEVPDVSNPGMPSRSYLERRPILIKDYRRCASVRLFDPLARKRKIKSIASIPLAVHDIVIGVLVAATGEDKGIRENDLSEINRLACQLTLSIHKLTADKELVRSKERAELYVDLLCHDINNINQAAAVQLEIASGLECLDDSVRSLVRKPLEAIRNTDRIIKSVKRIQRVESPEFSLKPVMLEEVILDCISESSEMYGDRAKITYTGISGAVVYASSYLKDVFHNIFDNALKHSNRNVNVNVCVQEHMREDRLFYQISIEDDGYGIPSNVKDTIFKRLEPGLKKAHGKGIGLFIVRTFTEKFGGKVWAEDRVSGDHTKGSRFVILLPGYTYVPGVEDL